MVESANQFSLEELCRTQYSLKYFFRSHVDHQTYGKTLTVKVRARGILKTKISFFLAVIQFSDQKNTKVQEIVSNKPPSSTGK